MDLTKWQNDWPINIYNLGSRFVLTLFHAIFTKFKVQQNAANILSDQNFAKKKFGKLGFENDLVFLITHY